MPSYDYDRINLVYQPQQTFRRNQHSLLVRLIGVFVLITGLALILFAIHGLKNGDKKAAPAHLQQSVSCPSVSFDYLQMTITWPATFCLFEHCPRNLTLDWGIHGLWPNYNNGINPEFCCPAWPFDANQVKDLEPQLLKKWFNLNTKSDENNFLAHEWDKHGTCAKQSELLDSQHKYFAAGLAIYDQYPFWDWLNEADIVPSATKSYEFANIVRVIQARFPKLITVGCRSYKVDNKHHNLLDKIEFCFSKDLQPVDCKHQRDHCEGPVYYPVPNQDFKLTDNMNQTTISTPASSSSAPSASLSSSKINQN